MPWDECREVECSKSQPQQRTHGAVEWTHGHAGHVSPDEEEIWMRLEKGPKAKVSNHGSAKAVEVKFWIAGIAKAPDIRTGCARHLKELELRRDVHNVQYARAGDMGRSPARVQVAAAIAHNLQKGSRA